jgi:hypothetical protein
MKINICFYKVFLFLTLFSSSAFAQFDKVIVKMQSGSEVQLTELPWFKFALNISNGQWKNRATTADWIVAAPPPFCPYGNSYKLVWKGDVNAFKNESVDQCSSVQREKLAGLPSEINKLCNCKIILETVSRVENNKTIWRSLDDETLKSEEFKFRRTLVGPKGELPVIFSVGSANAGIYNFSGDKLCTFNGVNSDTNKASRALDQINSILKVGDKPRPILCFENMHGEIDISKVYYSAFSSKILGDIYLNLNNGEKYVVKPD